MIQTSPSHRGVAEQAMGVAGHLGEREMRDSAVVEWATFV